MNTKISLHVIHTEGGAVISSLFCFSTSLCIVTVSKAQPLCARVASCLIAVRNPWKIKPQIQYILPWWKNKNLAHYLHSSALNVTRQIFRVLMTPHALTNDNKLCFATFLFLFWPHRRHWTEKYFFKWHIKYIFLLTEQLSGLKVFSGYWLIYYYAINYRIHSRSVLQERSWRQVRY